MSVFFESNSCKLGMHCYVCRSVTHEGIAFRSVIRRRFPELAEAWECPNGRPWKAMVISSPAAPLVRTIVRVERVDVDPDIRNAKFKELREMITALPEAARNEGVALHVKQLEQIRTDTCTKCARNRALATLRVWLQKQRNAQKISEQSTLSSTTEHGQTNGNNAEQNDPQQSAAIS